MEQEGGPYLPGRKMVSTHKENRIFLHLLSGPGKKLVLPLKEGIVLKSVAFLEGGAPLKYTRKKDSVILKLPGTLPDELATVVVLTLDSPASDLDLIKL